MIRMLLWLSVMSTLLLPFTAMADSYIARSERYIDCTVQTQKAPVQALALSQGWLAEGATAPALHCKALALYALKKYDKSAEILARLRRALPEDQPSLQTHILLQAAHAARRAGQYDTALAHLHDGIALAMEHDLTDAHIRLLYVRAAMREEQQDPHASLQDLDNILALDDSQKKARLRRARLYDQLGHKDLANQDYTAIVGSHNHHTASDDTTLMEIVSGQE